MKKIWYGIIMWMCMVQQTVRTNPPIASDFQDQLVATFKASSRANLRPFVTELQSHNISASAFIQIAAQNRVACALNRVQHLLDLQATDMSAIESAIHHGQEAYTNKIMYSCPAPLKTQLPTLKEIIQNQPYRWPRNFTIHYATTDETMSVVSFCEEPQSFSLYLPRTFLSLPEAEQVTLLGHEHIHLIKHHNERLYMLEAILKMSPTGKNTTQVSDPLRKLYKAHEYEADWLSLLSNDPATIQQGIQQLKDQEGDEEHPCGNKRIAWIAKFARLLSIEQQQSPEE